MKKSENKFNVKKVVNIAGNVVMAAALIFVAKKIADMDIDFSRFSSPDVIAALVISTIIQALLILCACFPWLVFTQSLSGRRIPFSSAMPVYTRSNIYKYVPGNVFQYIGRNSLATDMNISHVDVACATILDILFCVLWTGVISVVLLGSEIAELLAKYGRNLLIIAAVGAAVAAAAAVVVKLKFADKVRKYLSRYSKAAAKGNRGKLIQGIVYYLVHNSVSAAMYFVCLHLVFGGELGFAELASLTGAFMFAWIIGFVTPGAPGGIGIRESVMLFVCGDKYEEKVLLFVLAMRISSILADIAAFIVGRIYHRAVTKNNNA